MLKKNPGSPCSRFQEMARAQGDDSVGIIIHRDGKRSIRVDVHDKKRGMDALEAAMAMVAAGPDKPAAKPTIEQVWFDEQVKLCVELNPFDLKTVYREIGYLAEVDDYKIVLKPTADYTGYYMVVIPRGAIRRISISHVQDEKPAR